MDVRISFAAPISLCDILNLILVSVMPHGHKTAAVPPGITFAFQARRRMKR